MRTAIFAAIAAVGFATVATGATLSVASARPVFVVGDTITLTVSGDAQGVGNDILRQNADAIVAELPEPNSTLGLLACAGLLGLLEIFRRDKGLLPRLIVPVGALGVFIWDWLAPSELSRRVDSGADICLMLFGVYMVFLWNTARSKALRNKMK